MTEVPSYFAGMTGLNEVTAQIILSLVLICLIYFPYLIASKGKPDTTISFIMIFIGLSIAIGLGWAPSWLLIMILLIVALGWAYLGASKTTGG